MDVEPYPIENDELWAEGSVQYLERYEYIEERANRYLNQYRESEEYDFTKFSTKAYEKAIIRGYDDFAKGTLKLLGMELICRNYVQDMKRKVATPVTDEERAAAAEAKKPVPQWRKDWEAKRDAAKKKAQEDLLRSQPSPDRCKRILERAFHGNPETSPMPGVFCYSLDEDAGFTPEGVKIGAALAYCQVHWDRYEYENPGKSRPASLLPDAPEVAPIRQKTMEDLERERIEIEERKRQEKLRERLKRGR
jgi:hypothetical protein